MTDGDYALIVKRLFEKVGVKSITKELGRGKSRIYQIKNLVLNGQPLRGGPRTGRPRIMDERSLRRLWKALDDDPNLTLEELSRLFPEPGPSSRTIERRIRENPDFFSGWKLTKPFINEETRKARVAWCKKYQHWTAEDWEKVLFTDESPFTIRFHRRLRIWKKRGDRYNPKYCAGRIKHDTKINVWGCFSVSGVGDLKKVEGIMESGQYLDILNQHMGPSADKLFGKQVTPTWILQADNDPKHTAKLVQTFLQDSGLQILDWPSYSPDLNPIENLWSIIDYASQSRQCKNEDELFLTLENAWKAISVDTLATLVHSMPRRIAAVLKADGKATKY